MINNNSLPDNNKEQPPRIVGENPIHLTEEIGNLIKPTSMRPMKSVLGVKSIKRSPVKKTNLPGKPIL